MQLAEPARRPDCGDGRELFLLAMKLEKRAEVDVRYAVAVRDHELIAFDVLARSVDSAAGLRRLSSLREENAPLLLRMEWLQVLDAALADVNTNVAVHRAVVKEVVPDHVALVAETENEIHDPEVGVELHDVPEDRLSTDLDHRLRSDLGLLREARS